MKAYCNPWKTLATLLFAAALYNLEEKRGQSALSLCWEILFNGSQVIHCLKLTSFLCLCFSKSTVSKADKSWTFSLLKACQGCKSPKGCGEWKTVGMQSGGGRRKTRWAHQAFLSWHMMPAWFWGTPCLSAPWDPKDREGRGSVCNRVGAFPVWLHSHVAASCLNSWSESFLNASWLPPLDVLRLHPLKQNGSYSQAPQMMVYSCSSLFFISTNVFMQII